MVAEMGLEPHDLRVMSPTSYQLLYSASLKCYIILYDREKFVNCFAVFSQKIFTPAKNARFLKDFYPSAFIYRNAR